MVSQDSKVSADLTSIGSLFHSVEAEKPKLLSPYDLSRAPELEADLDAKVLIHTNVYEASQDNKGNLIQAHSDIYKSTEGV